MRKSWFPLKYVFRSPQKQMEMIWLWGCAIASREKKLVLVLTKKAGEVRLPKNKSRLWSTQKQLERSPGLFKKHFVNVKWLVMVGLQVKNNWLWSPQKRLDMPTGLLKNHLVSSPQKQLKIFRLPVKYKRDWSPQKHLKMSTGLLKKHLVMSPPEQLESVRLPEKL